MKRLIKMFFLKIKEFSKNTDPMYSLIIYFASLTVLLQIFCSFFSIRYTIYFFPLITVLFIYLSYLTFRQCSKKVFIFSLFWFVPILTYTYPWGFDPYGHLFLIDRILQTGIMVTDWSPLEDIPLNYPTGAHALLATVIYATKIKPFIIYKFFMSLIGFLTSLGVYDFYKRSYNERLGFLSWYSYTFIIFYGGLHYLTWGGLPNLLSMLFFLYLVCALDEKKFNYVLIFALAIMLTHHNTMLILFLYFFVVYIIQLKTMRKHNFIILKTLLYSTPVWIPYLLRITSFKYTGMDLYKEPLLTFPRLFNLYGLSFYPLLFFGTYLVILKKQKVKFIEVIWLLLVCFVMFEYVGRFVSFKLTGIEKAYMAPSRFLTNLSYFLPIVLALALNEISKKIPKFKFAILLIFLVAINFAQLKKMFGEQLDKNFVLAYEWARENTPSDSRIFSKHAYSSYFSKRISSSTLIPSSEFWKLMRNYQELVQLNSTTDISYPVYVISEKAGVGSIVYDLNGVKIYKLK